jgi:hypothetical protein
VIGAVSCARKCCERGACRVAGWFSQCFHGSGASGRMFSVGVFHGAFTVKCKRRDVFTYYPPIKARAYMYMGGFETW